MKTPRPRVGIQSIEVGFRLLDVLSHSDRALTLSNLSAAAGLSASKAHRYLVSFIRVGIVEQNMETGQYDLGPKALTLGLGAMRRLDILSYAEPIMSDLRDKLDESVSLCMWTDNRPTIVRAIASSRPIHVRGTLGSQLPLLTSAVGRVFLTWRPGPDVDELIASELQTEAAVRAGISSRFDVEAIRSATRARGYGEDLGQSFRGFSVIAAPVFDHTNSAAAAIVCVGTEDAFGGSKSSSAAVALVHAASTLSGLIGFQPGKEIPH